MDLGLAISSRNVCSVPSGRNLWLRKHSNNIYNPICFAPKASQHIRKSQIECTSLRFQQSSLNHHSKCIGGGSIFQHCSKKYIPKATIDQSSHYEAHASKPKNFFDSLKNFLVAVYWFCYPYAMIGRTFSTISASLLAVEKLSDITSPLFFIGVLQAWIPHLFMDFYANGVNQLFDLDIDKINKPYLPLASGQLSFTTGAIIVALSAIMSFGLSWIIGSQPMIWSIGVSFLLWTAYSINVPLLRWKKHPLLAAMCIFVNLALIFPLTFFFHMQTFVLKRPAVFTRPLMFHVAFLSLYSIGIALFKDIPDIEGDKAFGIHSISARLGQKRVFWICIAIFELAFGIFLLGGVTSSFLWTKIAVGLGHAVLASVLWYKAKSIDLSSKDSIRSGYMLIWKVFWICIAIFELAFGIFLLGGVTSSFLWTKIAVALGHAVLASVLWYKAKSIDLSSKDSIRSGAYMLIWKLFSATQMLMPLIK